MAPNGFSLGDVDYELKLLATLFTYKTINNEKNSFYKKTPTTKKKIPPQ